jgi:hypothetical protein
MDLTQRARELEQELRIRILHKETRIVCIESALSAVQDDARWHAAAELATLQADAQDLRAEVARLSTAILDRRTHTTAKMVADATAQATRLIELERENAALREALTKGWTVIHPLDPGQER